MNNKFIDTCKLLGNYNNQDVYLYNSANMKHLEFFIVLITITYQNGQMLKNYHYYKQ